VHVASADATANVTLPLAIHIEGKVTKSGGTGLADIEVDASATNIDYYTSTVTDASGNYSVAVAPNSSDTLYFYDGSGKYGDGYYSTAGFTYSPTAATAVAVASADVTGKNVTLPLAVHIKGKVTKSGGTGLGDIEVYVADNFNTYETWTWTAADGTYSLTTAPGTYTLAFYDPSGTYGGGYYSTAGFTYYPSKATKVTVSSADVTGKNVTLPLAVYIEGKVTKSGGTGLGNIEVEAFNASYDTWDPTASDGTYFVSVAPGTYTLLFSDETGKYASGYYSTGGFVYNASGASSVTVASASITGKNVTLPLAVRITGKVTDAGDNGLPNIEIMASSADRTYANGAPSEADGTYSMPVIPGSYKVWFQDRSGVNGSGFYSITGFVYDEASASAVLVSTTDATDIDVKMVPGSSQVFPASTYYAIPPARVLDTRPTGSGHTNIGLAGKFTAGTVRTFNVAAVNYVGGGTKIDVPLWADAVTGNLTIVGETTAGLIALGPTMAPTGDTTTINFVKGDTRANNVTVGLSPDGSLSAVYRSSTGGATVDLIFDVTGYFLPWTAYGSTYHALAPGRVLDTRKTGSGHTNIGLVGKFANKVPRTFPVAGVKGLGWTSAQVPSSATAVTGNLTITNATSVGYVSVGPTIAAVPSTSTLNVAQGANIANGVTVALNAGKLQAVWDGTVGSSADVIFDITGYFTPDTSGLAYHPIVPDRLLDTSTNKGLTGAFTNLVSRPLVVGGVDAIPANAAGISGNLTVVNPSSNGFAFISPDAVASPTSSTININAHLSGANGFDVALDTGNLSLIWCGTVGSTADLQLDVTGYWK
jgi:phage baseplate assembly protein gpV